MVDYPKEFVEKVKAFYPNNRALHDFLEKGDPNAGWLLEEDGTILFQAKDIVQLFSDKKENEILEKAQRVVAQKELYLEWNKIFQKSL
ncbi:MAG: hypothetical protein WC414_04010 [Patescibacteria group bacterium]